MTPKLIVEQKITPIVNKYVIYAANPDGTKAQLVALAQQKRLAFKDKVTFYTDEQKSAVAFTFRAEKVLDVHGKFFVEDVNGALIGAFQKIFKESLVKSTWNLLDTQFAPTLQVRESNSTIAVLRRYAGFIPFVGDLADLILLFFKYHFTIRTIDADAEVGEYRKTTLFRDHYVLLMNDDAFARQDWRVLASMAVALDALQAR